MHHLSRPFIRPVPMSETEIQHAILDFLRKKYGSRADVMKVPLQAMKVAGGRSAKNPMAGSPDIHFCLDGRCRWIEVKIPGGVLSPIQAIRHTAIREAGGVVYVVHSLDEAMSALEGVH